MLTLRLLTLRYFTGFGICRRQFFHGVANIQCRSDCIIYCFGSTVSLFFRMPHAVEYKKRNKLSCYAAIISKKVDDYSNMPYARIFVCFIISVSFLPVEYQKLQSNRILIENQNHYVRSIFVVELVIPPMFLLIRPSDSLQSLKEFINRNKTYNTRDKVYLHTLSSCSLVRRCLFPNKCISICSSAWIKSNFIKKKTDILYEDRRYCNSLDSSKNANLTSISLNPSTQLRFYWLLKHV